MTGHGSLTATLDLRGDARPHRLELRDPGAEPRRIEVVDLTEIGRRRVPPAGLVAVRHTGVSRRHARLQVLGGQLAITDLGSMNGTFVNGVRITATTRLSPGDVVRLADVELTVLGEDPEHPDGRPAARPAEQPAGRAPANPPAVLNFPNYLQLPRRLPPGAWRVAQTVALTAVAGLCGLLVLRPETGLLLLWGLVVPSLPLVWLVAPGFWRNSCPLAAVNQLPRIARFALARNPPKWLRDNGFLIATGLFLVAVAGRRPLFDHSGPASAALLLGALSGAFLGGVLLKGKSGWCSSICPLLPIQRLYGQTPFATVPNSHCRPCVGCAKHCYDFNPTVAYQADLHDGSPRWTVPRKLFAGGLPGVVVGYNAAPEPFLLWFCAAVLVSVGTFVALESLVRVWASVLAAAYAAVAVTAFYWWSGPVLATTLAGFAPQQAAAALSATVGWGLRLGVPVLAAVWFWRTTRVRRRFVRHAVLAPGVASAAPLAGPVVGGVEVTFQPHGRRIVAGVGSTLLELAERDGLPIEAGCRMGVCGADPVQILEGDLSPAGDDETATLRRLDLGPQTRLACCARVTGPVTVSLDPARARPAVTSRPARRLGAPSLGRVVIVGNGIAGVTVAEQVRRADPSAEIHVVGREAHPLYNRMGISRVVHGRTAMAGLFLQAEDWYERRDITCWLNTRAVELSIADRLVTLGTGHELPYDRLVLATGARPAPPSLGGADRPGCFVLRDADDAIRIRAYVQEHRAARAVVIGAGPLAVEGAYALHELGLAVSIVIRGDALLRQHLDRQAADLLAGYLGARGVVLVPGATVVAVEGTGRVRTAVLGDGRRLSTDLVLVCAGATPDAALARDAGLAVRRGIVVDDRMRTGAPGVYAAGDVAEVAGVVSGLWPAAVKQAGVVAANLLGEPRTAPPSTTTPMLVKGIGIDLVSAGRLDPRPGERVLVSRDAGGYGRLVLDGDRLVGAVLLGRPKESAAMVAAVGGTVPEQARTPGWVQAH